MSSRRKQEAIKARFSQLDTNKDNYLDFEELRDLLSKGGNFTDREIQTLYDQCDKDGDHRISFAEFVDYIYTQEKTGAGRHAMLAAESAVGDDGTESDWGSVASVFEAFAGKDMDGREFRKFCEDNNIIDRKFKKTDTDIIFAKVVPKGKRRMDFEMFKNACRHISKKRECTTGHLQKIIAESDGPHLHGTQADAVRFHDDKSLYTGSHSYNERHAGADPSASMGRHERLAAENAVSKGDSEDDWAEVDRVFDAFAERDGQLDSKEFNKMCHDIAGLVNPGNHGGFTKRDIDIVFTEACRSSGVRKMDNVVFQEAVRRIAKRKGVAVFEVQSLVGRSEGPVRHATKALATRLHDDDSTYTGVKSTGPKDDRHARLKAQHDALAQESLDEHDWGKCLIVFELFAGSDGLDSGEFYKMVNDCNIIDSHFKRTHCDVVFQSAVGRGRKIFPETFKTAIRAIANRKDQPVWQVQQQVETCKGPHSHATKADAVRFHDDKFQYTGTHAGKHIG
mmetsp:Transcript_13794/g.24016  ORF Transcript_13794/g.24016 Transcript_13794/m.24016 type:complete len:508 (+) Transcript_13794:54-1577(+)